jgi:hypothetical protein
MSLDPTITIDYWQTAYALGRAVEATRSQLGDAVADEVFGNIVIELDKVTHPPLDWANVMTDSPAYHPPEVKHNGT